MNQDDIHDKMRDAAALYAIGALSDEEARTLEAHIADGCEACAAAVAEFTEVSSYLALCAPPVEPPPHLRAALLDAIAQDALPLSSSANTASTVSTALASPKFLTVQAGEGEWLPLAEGVHVKLLHEDPTKGTATTLVRMEPGAHAPAHRHFYGEEQCIVIEGDFHIDGEIIGPGGYHRAEAGTTHRSVYTVNGALLLIVGPREGFQIVETP